jgi:glycosyltransferase involved in cell wall biosynthesis
VYNQGQHYLAEQLDSFSTQSYTNWELWASDDGSKDQTLEILEEYRQKWPTGRLSIYFGPAKGYAANFLQLTCNAGIKADFYAYSDQDDIWEKDKLERALRWLESIPENIPALYCSRIRNAVQCYESFKRGIYCNNREFIKGLRKQSTY